MTVRYKNAVGVGPAGDQERYREWYRQRQGWEDPEMERVRKSQTNKVVTG